MDKLRILERSWLYWRAGLGYQLPENLSWWYDYGFRLGQYYGEEKISGVMLEFRDWFVSVLMSCRRGEVWDKGRLMEALSSVRIAVSRARRHVLGSGVSESLLDSWVCQKDLALALGGGGGTGYAHMVVFQVLSELGIIPKLIVGTSFGSIMGYFRSLSLGYDVASSILRTPGWWDVSRNMWPYRGKSRHGMPSLFDFDFSSIIGRLTAEMHEEVFPRFESLSIKFGCVLTGIKSADVLSGEKFRGGKVSRILCGGILPVRYFWDTLVRVCRRLVSDESMLEEVVLGLDDISSHLRVVDALGFSSSVPGVLHHEVRAEHYESREFFDFLCGSRGIWRFSDGGLVNNVPCDVCYHQLDKGRVGKRNTFIWGVDVFSPDSTIGSMFKPLQQIANSNVVARMVYADAMSRLHYLFSPLNLAPSLSQMEVLHRELSKELSVVRGVLKIAMKPLKGFSEMEKK